ncbi:MAG: flagellar biosynthetic protein FliQ [[Eubacterium] siraeum]
MRQATQVHEQTLSFAPKAIVVAIVLLLFGPWMMNSCIEFFNYIFGLMATVGAT